MPSKSKAKKKGPERPRVDAKWIRTKADLKAIKEGCWFDEAAGLRVIEFIETYLRHSEGKFSRSRFILEPWQRDWLMMTFGWMGPDGFRRFREVYLEVAKKNGKSALASALCLYGLFEEPGAQVFTGAVNRHQAQIVFKSAARMARSSAFLAEHFDIQKKGIYFDANNASFEPLSADVESKDGLNVSLVVLDEMHRYKTDDLYDILEHAGAARDQPLRIIITTAGDNVRSLCYRLREQALRIRDGTDLNTRFFGTVYAADPDDDLSDPKVWKKANPSLGSILKLKEFREDYLKARKVPKDFRRFKRLRLNIWTEAECQWLSVAKWDRLVDDDLESYRGRPCFVGLDVAARHDLTSMCLCFPDGDHFHFISYFFIPKETAEEKAETDRVPYPLWAEQGHLILTPGGSLEHESVVAKFEEVLAEYDVKGVGLDDWDASHIANKITEHGDAMGFKVEYIKQHYKFLSNPSKVFEAAILKGRASHPTNPVMRWCVGNVSVDEDALENIKPSKKKSKQRIDGVAAAVNALAVALADPGDEEPSITILRKGK